MSHHDDISTLPASGALPDAELVTSVSGDITAVVVPVFSGEEGPELPASAAENSIDARALLTSLEALGATGEHGEITRVALPDSTLNLIVAIGLGVAEDLDDEGVRRAAGTAARSLRSHEGKVLTELGAFGLRPAVEGWLLGSYAYPGLHDIDDETSLPPVAFLVPEDAADASKEEVFSAAVITAEAQALTRDLVNTPSNLLFPESFAAIITARLSDEAPGVEIEVLDDQELIDAGYGGITAVGQGSARGPRLVRLVHRPKNPVTRVGLVGKGITFDTGGISLKPAANMEKMISDMGGAAAVVATVLAAARLELPVEVIATIPIAENMPSGTATRPGDVIRHYGGITSEVINTDAEGRLVLADALARASEDHPTYLLDTATLTGAQTVALGDRTAGVMGTDDFRDEVAATGRQIGENAWAMPLLEEHEKTVVSPIADIRNSPNAREGGMLYAATYLSRFVGDEIQWAHVDVAGPSWNSSSPRGYTPTRATGVPTRTFIAVLEKLAQS